MDPIGEISAQVYQIQQAPADDDLSLLVKKVQMQLDALLSDGQSPTFGQAVVLQFSLLEGLKSRIGIKAYKESVQEKVKQISEKTLPDEEEQEEIQLYLASFQEV